MTPHNRIDQQLLLQRSRPKANDVRGAYFRDQTAIIHSLPFRRLKHKTQVFFAPENDHVCTRIEHVMHVATIASAICKGLNMQGWQMDVEMAFAIGLGHDLGHAPFGHDGESVLNKLMGGNNAFVHEINSYRIVEYLAAKGKGLNLTYAVKDGIICHNGEKFEQHLLPVHEVKNLDAIRNRANVPSTFEGCIMRFSDKIAYLGRDIEDAIAVGLIGRNDIPDEIGKNLGHSNGEIIDRLITDLINYSAQNQCIGFSDDVFRLMLLFRDFNYQHIYLSPKREQAYPFAQNIISTLFDYLQQLIAKHGHDLPAYQHGAIALDAEFGNYLGDMSGFYTANTPPAQIVCDYVGGMTDSYAIQCFKQILFPPSVLPKSRYAF